MMRNMKTIMMVKMVCIVGLIEIILIGKRC
jgi:hypothetical protein